MTAAAAEASEIIATLRSLGSEHNRTGMARFGINTDRAFGVSIATMEPLAKPYRRRHDLAAALWASGFHEARVFAAMIEDPAEVTPDQMDDWVADFDSWDVCDQACSRVFARTAFAGPKVRQWAEDDREFVRRAAFATLAAMTVRMKAAKDEAFMPFLQLIDRYADDDRNFVRKAVNWALRQIGKRSSGLNRAAVALATRLAASDDKSRRWIGKDALRELTDPKQLARIAARQ